MSDSPQQDKKSDALYAVGFVMILVGIAAMLFFISGNFTYNAIGLLVMITGVGLVRVSRVRGLRGFIAKGARGSSEVMSRSSLAAGKGPSWKMWLLGVVLLVPLGISYFLLHEDAVHGGHQGWPVYLFAGTGLVCVLFWSYLITKLQLSLSR